jgi:hypothetical protein
VTSGKHLSQLYTARYRIAVVDALPMLGSDPILKEFHRRVNVKSLTNLFKNLDGSSNPSLKWYIERDLGRNIINEIK